MMKPLPMLLKVKLLILAVIFPVSFLFAGIMVSNNTSLFGIESEFAIQTPLFATLGFLLGLLLNFVCYYRKLFALTIYQTPIPLSLFLVFRWVADIFVGEFAALGVGIIGLLLGLWLNKELVLPYLFYKIPKRILAILYLFYSIVAMGIFMGVPVLNVLLGLFAGNYLAMRIISYIKDKKEHNRNINQGSFYSAFIVLLISSISGIIALNDIDSYISLIHQFTTVQLSSENFMRFLIITSISITILQFFITRFTAKTMLSLFLHRKSLA